PLSFSSAKFRNFYRLFLPFFPILEYVNLKRKIQNITSIFLQISISIIYRLLLQFLNLRSKISFGARPLNSLSLRKILGKMTDWTTVKEYDDITYRKKGGVARIAINRPEVRNAFRPKTTSELYDAF